jgi:hypothetical protein
MFQYKRPSLSTFDLNLVFDRRAVQSENRDYIFRSQSEAIYTNLHRTVDRFDK